MIVSFRNAATEDVYDGEPSPRARRICPHSIWRIARRKLDMIHQAQRLEDLGSPPGNRLEALRADRAGQHSIRINDQYRVCFVWTDRGAEDVEITDYH
jgi:toxin HigB-1